MSDEQITAQATPAGELRRQILSPHIGKNEREWWAARTIEKLERQLNAANQRIKRLEELGKELRECASQLGWSSSDDSRWIERAEAAVKAWDKEAKP